MFGVTVFSRPGAGLIAVLWLLGMYAVLYGIMMVMLAFKAEPRKDVPDTPLGGGAGGRQ